MDNPARLRHIPSIPNRILTYMYDIRFNEAVLATLHMEMPVNAMTMCFEWNEYDPDFENAIDPNSINESIIGLTSCVYN